MNELTILKDINAVDVFTSENGIDPILKAIKEEVKKFVPDLTTANGRQEIASMAHKIAKSKTYLDKLGKDLTEEWRKNTSLVNASRKKVVSELDALKAEVRKPLTDWENKEKERVAALENRLYVLEMQADNLSDVSLEDMKKSLEFVSKPIDESWEEFQYKAGQMRLKVIEKLTFAIQGREKYLAEQAELEKLRAEKAQREKEEYERKLKEEAAAKAKAEAEEAARLEAERKENERLEEERKMMAKLKAEQEEKERIEREKIEAEKRAERAEYEKIEAEKRAEEERIAAKEREIQAKSDAEIKRKEAERIAIENERKRVEQEEEAKERERIRREADQKHRKLINNEAKDSLMETIGFSDTEAEEVVIAIAKGFIKNVTINY